MEIDSIDAINLEYSDFRDYISSLDTLEFNDFCRDMVSLEFYEIIAVATNIIKKKRVASSHIIFEKFKIEHLT